MQGIRLPLAANISTSPPLTDPKWKWGIDIAGVWDGIINGEVFRSYGGNFVVVKAADGNAFVLFSATSDLNEIQAKLDAEAEQKATPAPKAAAPKAAAKAPAAKAAAPAAKKPVAKKPAAPAKPSRPAAPPKPKRD